MEAVLEGRVVRVQVAAGAAGVVVALLDYKMAVMLTLIARVLPETRAGGLLAALQGTAATQMVARALLVIPAPQGRLVIPEVRVIRAVLEYLLQLFLKHLRAVAQEPLETPVMLVMAETAAQGPMVVAVAASKFIIYVIAQELATLPALPETAPAVVLVVVMVVLAVRLYPPLWQVVMVVRVDQAAQEIREAGVLPATLVVLEGQQALQPLIALP